MNGRKDPVDLLPTRQSLLSRLKDWDDQISWKTFFDTYWRLIYGTAIKAGLTEAEAEDVVQETVISVAKKVPDFKYDRSLGSFKGWLLNLTQWRIRDQLRKRSPALASERQTSCEREGTSLEMVADPNATLEAAWEEEWESNLMAVALDRVKRRVKEEHYQIFDLYALKGWPVAKVTRTLGVTVAKVYLAKHRLALLVKKEVKQLKKQIL